MSELSKTASVLDICMRHENRPDCLLEILHEVQENAGFLCDHDLEIIATTLNISRADVHGVVSFYHDFRREAPGKKVIKICMAEACQASGCDVIKDHAEKSLSVVMGNTSIDGEVTLEAVYCLGNCALGPAMMVDGVLFGRVTAKYFDALILGQET